MTAEAGVPDWKAFVEHHRTLSTLFLLAIIFVSGLFDALVFKEKGWACATWIFGLIVLVFWIAHSWTTASVLSAAVVLASGLTLAVRYYLRIARR
jgi:hypothetical protein